MRADKRYYVTADRSRIVEEDDPEAAILLAPEGGDISNEDAKRYQLGRYAPEPEQDNAGSVKAEEKPAETKAVGAPPENKARTSSAKKDDKD